MRIHLTVVTPEVIAAPRTHRRFFVVDKDTTIFYLWRLLNITSFLDVNVRICIINGFFVKRMKVIKYKDIKSVEIIDGIISKKYGICKLKLNFMEKFNILSNSTGYIKIEDMYKIVGKVLDDT